MSSSQRRDPQKDHLITPENSALIIIDYQPVQIDSINSMSRSKLIFNIVLLAKLAKVYRLPVILSTVNVKNGVNKPTISAITNELGNLNSYDRTSINAWEDEDFYNAVKATGRKKLIMAALWTEACLTFPTLDAIGEGFEVYPVIDAVGGTSKLAHEIALRRIEQAGAHLISIPQLTCELQRDWNRHDTVKGMVDIFRQAGIFLQLD